MSEYIDSLYIIDLKGKILYSNFQKTQIENKFDQINSIVGYISKSELNNSLEKIKNGENICFNLFSRDTSDKSKELFCLITPLYDKNGKINTASVIVADRKYEFLFNENNDAIFITDLKGRYLEVNRVAANRSGLHHDKFKELSLLNIPSKQNPDVIKSYFTNIIEEGSATQQIDYTNSDGNSIHIEVKGKKINFGGESAILHSSREISERKKSDREILEALIQSEEKDRKYFSSEILDNLGPILSLNLMLVETYFDTEKNKIKDQIIEKVKTNLSEALKIITELTMNISPQILTRYGLRPAFHTFITKLAENHKVKITLTLEIPEKFSEKIDIVLYRTFVEIVNYFVKYRCVSFLHIDISFKNKLFNSLIKSDKKYIPLDVKPDDNYQLKQLNLKSRLQSINGEIEFNPVKDIDQVIIEVPINDLEI